METQNECLEALASGKTLTNQYGVKVRLDKFGFQSITGRMGHLRKGAPYAFSSPKYWNAIEEPKENSNTTLVVILSTVMVLLGTILWNNQASTVALQEEVKVLKTTLTIRDSELSGYLVTEQELVGLGASSEQAKDIIKAAEVHTISPKF